MTSVLGEIITLLTSGITQMATGIGSGVGQLVQNIFLQTAETGEITLSVFGGVTVIFAGVGLAIGLSKLVMHWIGSLGGSNM